MVVPCKTLGGSWWGSNTERGEELKQQGGCGGGRNKDGACEVSNMEGLCKQHGGCWWGSNTERGEELKQKEGTDRG